VRKLAENTIKASSEISKVMDGLRIEVTRMLEDASGMKEMADASKTSVTNLEQQFVTFAESAKESLIKISYVHDVSFASLTKMDHFIYKQNAYLALDHGVNSDEANAAKETETECGLGRWSDENKVEGDLRHLQSFSRLAEPHARLHQKMQEALVFLAEDWPSHPDIQEKMYQAFVEAEQASDQLVDLLDQLVQEKHGQISKKI
jgi:hypothetical protein